MLVLLCCEQSLFVSVSQKEVVCIHCRKKPKGVGKKAAAAAVKAANKEAAPGDAEPKRPRGRPPKAAAPVPHPTSDAPGGADGAKPARKRAPRKPAGEGQPGPGGSDAAPSPRKRAPRAVAADPGATSGAPGGAKPTRKRASKKSLESSEPAAAVLRGVFGGQSEDFRERGGAASSADLEWDYGGPVPSWRSQGGAIEGRNGVAVRGAVATLGAIVLSDSGSDQWEQGRFSSPEPVQENSGDRYVIKLAGGAFLGWGAQ